MKKILVVAMADSIHTARWLEQFEGSEYEFLLFPSSPHRRIHPKISRLLSSDSTMNITTPFGLKHTGLFLAALDKLFANRIRGLLLRRFIKRFNPDVLHAVETQGAGYISSVALERIKNKPIFILTLWGSDLFWFRRFKRHEAQLKNLLPQVDLLSMECSRDIVIAKEFGFVGEIFPPFPVTGGYELLVQKSDSPKTPPSARKVILIKGHTRFVGRGLIALDAIEKVADLLADYEIIVYSADPQAIRRVRKLVKDTQLNVRSFKRGELPHYELLSFFKSARIYVGISLSDGISVSLQEAMVHGAFPIQTDTSCIDEWITDGQGGFIVRNSDFQRLDSLLKRALDDDALVDTAAEINYSIASERLDREIVLRLSADFYEKVPLKI